MNTTHRNIATALVLAALAAPAVWAQGPSSTNIGSSATLTIPLEISGTQSVNFGELVKTAAHNTGTVTVTLAADLSFGTLISADSAKVVDPNPGDHTEGAVVFTGDPTKQVVINLGPTAIKLTKPGASTLQQEMDLDINYFLSNPATVQMLTPTAADTYQMPVEGEALVEIGGDLHVKFDNESGVYSGNIPVTLSYL